MDIWVAIILVTFGLLFLALEVFVFPGVGISGLLGVVALIGGIVVAFMLDTYTGYYMLASVVVGSSALIYISIRLDSFSVMSLQKNSDSSMKVNHLEELKENDKGVSISRLAPMGKARINSFVVEVSSRTGFIDENVAIKIERITDNTIFVSPL
tara:strand:+ start:77316 stop:77777 length:462 start_codon:yes stop_codon:yes gene_type:complete